MPLLMAWFVCGVLLLAHHRAIREYVDLLNAVQPARAADAGLPMQQVIPARFADAQMWARHVTAAREAGEARTRFTRVDNAPLGREVHWSSGFGWLLRGASAIHRAATGE